MASLLSALATEDTADHSLPSFTTFSTELEPSWEYYDRTASEKNATISTDTAIASQNSSNYTRPWEMESKEVKGFEPFPKLPSFQSQFHAYNDPPTEPTLAHPVPVPVSPSAITSPLNGSLTQLTPIHTLTPLSLPAPTSFHTLTTVQAGHPPAPRTYPVVPAPIQARDIPTIQQQYLDERHIQLYQPIGGFAPTQNVVTVVQKNEIHNGMLPHNPVNHQTAFHIAPIQNPPIINGNPAAFNGATKNTKDIEGAPMPSVDNSKKERSRKIRSSSIESNAESEGSAMDLGDMSSGQVSAVSSTANFKSHMGNSMTQDSQDSEGGEKGLKQKKRKRCGECHGCQRKDNCGDCAPCRNDKSHQICKQRRCEKLTDKKMIYGADGTLIRGESKRGRGKGRGSGSTRGSFRGRKSLKFSGAASSPKGKGAGDSPQQTSVPQGSPNNGTTLNVNSVNHAGDSQVNGKPNTQVVQCPTQAPQHIVHHQQQPQQITPKDEGQQLAPMSFYPAWQPAPDPAQGWQNQFMQQIPQNATATATIAPLNTIEFQQNYVYPAGNAYVQTFDPNYGRAYAAPAIQRYEFQPNNQVSLQNVSFAPTTVTYAGQVSTGPSPIVLSGPSGQQGLSLSGNDQPGYPRVSSVPPPSLNYKGYAGENSGKATPTQDRVNTDGSQLHNMNPPPAPQFMQSPSRQTPVGSISSAQFSPGHQMQHSPQAFSGHPQQPSPNPHLSNVINYSVATPSPSGTEWGDWSNGGGSSGDMYHHQAAPGQRLNLNTRLKTMILNKNDSGIIQSPNATHHTSSMELSPPPSNGSAHESSQNSGHFAIIKNVC